MPVTMAEAIVSHVYNLQDRVKMEENRSRYLSSRGVRWKNGGCL